MSDYLPIEIQENILKRLPVRSLIQLRSVSKDWKSFIDSSAFVNSYSCQQTHMLLKYDHNYETRFISIVDDDTFPVNRTPLNPPPPCFLRENLDYLNVVGSSHGVLCFYVTVDVEDSGRAVIWNPAIRRSFEVAVASVPSRDVYQNVLGFGICPSTNDPKIVKITYVERFRVRENVTVIPSQVEVFSLTTRAWRSLHNNLPCKSLQFQSPSNITYSLDIQGVIYWLATDMIDGCCKTIISFDTTNEEFGQVNLPNELARSRDYLYISKRRDSLVVLEYVDEPNGMLFNIWKMEDEGELGGLPKSFSKLFTFNVNTEDDLSILGFRQIGDPVIGFSDDELDQLFVYNSRTEQIINLGLDGDGFTISMHPYKETLFLHGQPNLVLDT